MESKWNAERSRARDVRLGAGAAGSAPRRTACVKGTSGVRNAWVIGGVIHHNDATMLRVTRVFLRRVEEDVVQRRVAIA